MGTLTVMKMTFLVIFVSWLCVWVLLPTKIYKNTWTPKLKLKLNTSYFQEQGTNLLLFTFPVMLIAALGCVYLHFQKKVNKPYAENGCSVDTSGQMAGLKRPVIVMPRLGIVNVVEATFAAMFVALSIWSLYNYLYISFGALHMHKVGEKVWEAKFRSVSLRLGYVGNICFAFIFFPVTRGSSLLPLVGLTSESSIKYHIWLGHLSTILFAAHSIGFIIYWIITDQMVLALEWSRDYVSNIAGEIAFVVSLVIWAASFPRFRRKMFEVFFYTHQLYIVYLLFYIFHVGVEYFCTILPGIFLFFIDRYLRFLQSRQSARLISARLSTSGSVELNFSKDPELKYNPTSTLFLNVPSISKLQWHPFTITSNCSMEPDKLSVVIKTGGSWSQKLYQQLSSPLDNLLISVEGPYGPISTHFLSREYLVMISGGSGITPFISIIREIILRSSQPKCKIPKILLICVFKNSADLAVLDLLLPMSPTPADIHISHIELQIKAYITKEKDQTVQTTPKLHTIWFKPNPSDSPIIASLGPNSWLWLGVIISSSFIMFLLLLGFVTRYYIHPMDHPETNMKYNWTLKTLWYSFFVCVCVFIATSSIFLWQKRQNGMNERQVKSLDVATPTTSPVPWLNNPDRELESLPNQSLVESTKLHFGARPDLKKILSECKESDVGVLVSGPTRMRHEVARICSSSLGKNLHFESISFNW